VLGEITSVLTTTVSLCLTRRPCDTIGHHNWNKTLHQQLRLDRMAVIGLILECGRSGVRDLCPIHTADATQLGS